MKLLYNIFDYVILKNLLSSSSTTNPIDSG